MTNPTTLTKEEAVSIALEVERLEAVLKKMKESLKEYVDANGELVAGDKVWNYSLSGSWKFNALKLKEIAMALVAEEKNPWEFLNLPADSIKKLGWNESILAQYGEKKETKRFDSKKATVEQQAVAAAETSSNAASSSHPVDVDRLVG